MAKKKSKTQKYKRSVKKKQQKAQLLKQETQKQTDNLPKKEKQLVSKDKVNYNIALHQPIPSKEKENQIKENFFQKISKKVKIKMMEKQQDQKRKKKIQVKKEEEKIVLPKLKTTNNKRETRQKQEKPLKKKNICIRLFYDIKNNIHIIFNAILILTFIIMVIGLVRIKVFEKSTILYISCIILFLMLVAISYNKYISGKIFTTILVAGMCLAIFRMQYTYDFIRNLNSSMYEYKTYYVVTFDNGLNKSIYNINNKKVGLLKDNCINIERKLDTKLNKVSYLEYEDMNALFADFYEQKFRAILVNENQYKYLENNIQSNRKVKILYEFEANAKK